MNMKLIIMLMAALSVTVPGSVCAEGFRDGQREAFGDRFGAAPQVRRAPRRHDVKDGADTTQRLRHWNEVALDANALDHTPVAAGEIRMFGEQLGPTRTSRALAIVHIAIFDAINAITGEYQSYTGLAPAARDASIGAAIAQATHDTLIALSPRRQQPAISFWPKTSRKFRLDARR